RTLRPLIPPAIGFRLLSILTLRRGTRLRNRLNTDELAGSHSIWIQPASEAAIQVASLCHPNSLDVSKKVSSMSVQPLRYLATVTIAWLYVLLTTFAISAQTTRTPASKVGSSVRGRVV